MGKSEVVRVLEGFAQRNGVELNVAEGLPSDLLAVQAAMSYAVPLVVWDADLQNVGGTEEDENGGGGGGSGGGGAEARVESLAEYVSRHLKQLVERIAELCKAAHSDPGSGSDGQGSWPHPLSRDQRASLLKTLQGRMLVLCNKTDVQPCPLPEIAALDSGTIFLAGSALRGTNMKELWRYVEMCAAPRMRRDDRTAPGASLREASLPLRGRDSSLVRPLSTAPPSRPGSTQRMVLDFPMAPSLVPPSTVGVRLSTQRTGSVESLHSQSSAGSASSTSDGKACSSPTVSQDS